MIGEAKEKSTKIVSQAQKKAADLKASSEQWCLDNLQNFMETLRKLESVTQGGIENIRIKQRQDIDRKNGGK